MNELPRKALIGFVAVVASGGLTGLAWVGTQPDEAVRSPSVAGGQEVHPQITQAETRAEIEIHGRTWAEFLAQTTDRPTYDAGFVHAWLNQPTATSKGE